MANLVIVDDDPDNLEALAELMRLAGHDVRVGHHGEEGIRLVRQRQPDLAIFDVEMPLLGGPGLACRMFEEDRGLELIPVILLSGIVNLDEIAARVGTPYFLPKPARYDRLMGVVERALSERVAPRPRHPPAPPG